MKKLLLLPLLLLAALASAQSVHVGDILCTDNSIVSPADFPSSGKTALGVVFYVDSSDTHGWAVSLSDQTSSIQWSASWFYGYDIPGLPNFSNGRTALHDLNGYANTNIIRSSGDKYDFPAAWAVDYDNGWYLPSAGQLRYLYACSAEIRSSMLIAGGQTLCYWDKNYYWSSTEVGGWHAYDMAASGSIGDYVKDNNVNYPPYGISIRAIRDFQIPQPTHPEYHVGDLIINDDGSRGVLFYVAPDQTNGCMVALHDASAFAPWGGIGNVPDLPDQVLPAPYGSLLEETDGYGNTLKIRNYQNNPNTAAGLVNTDDGWYLPSAGQLSKLFGSLVFIEDKLSQYGSTFDEAYYWSSSEANASQAYGVTFLPAGNLRAGHFLLLDKVDGYHVRAVRDLVLNVNPPVVHDTIYGPPEVVVACDSLVWNDSTYFQSGTYTKTFPFYDHDSIATLQLTINESKVFEWSAIACDSFPWNDSIYGHSGDYVQSFYTVDGCDSIVTLHLTLNESKTFEWSAVACNSFPWNDSVYGHSGDYVQSFQTEDGCDSIVTLHLTVKTTEPVGEIQGEADIYYQMFGDFTYHIDPVSGCIGYEWSIDNQWPLSYDPSSPECTVSVITKGKATLKVRVYQECGVVERTLLIRHDYDPGFTIFPNPTDGDLTITLYGMVGPVTIQVHDLLGQCVHRFQVDTDMDGRNVSYTLRGKAAGVYFFTIVNNHDVFTKKVIKQSAASYGIREWWY